MEEKNNLNFLREELNKMVECDEIILHEGEILEKSKQLDKAIILYYKYKNV